MIRVVVCDDAVETVGQIKDISERLLKDNRTAYEVKGYTDTTELYYDIYDGKVFDIAILDIEMPHYSGIELAKILKEKQPECLVIFLTCHREYAIDAFELGIFRYVPKDELEIRFEKYFTEALKLISELDGKSYFIEKKGNMEKIPLKSIRYLKKSGKYTVIYSTDNRENRVRKPLYDIVEELKSPEFIIIDRGCAVNVCYVSKLSGNDVYLKNGEKLPVSRSNIKNVSQLLVRFWGEKV